jgi:hypothetical protein
LNGNTEVTGYSKPWVFGLPFILSGLVPDSSINIWHLKGPAGIDPTPETAGSANPRYVVKMAPVRFRIGDTGWGPFTPTLTRRYLNQANIETAFSNTSPPSAGHSGAATITSVAVTPPFGTLYNSALSGVKFASMWVNGVDVSGIVAVNALANQFGSALFACRSVVLSIAPSVITANQVIEFDFWFELSVAKTENFLNPATGVNTQSIPIIGAAPQSQNLQRPNLQFRANFSGINVQAKRATSHKYKMTFNANGPGGVTELTFEPQSNWSFQQLSLTSIRMTKTAGTGTGDTVTLNWGREIPEIRVTKNVTMPSGAQPIVRLLPANSGHYGQVDGNSIPGVWNPAGTTTFSVVGVFALTGLGGFGFIDSSRYPMNYFASFPTSVVVEKV